MDMNFFYGQLTEITWEGEVLRMMVEETPSIATMKLQTPTLQEFTRGISQHLGRKPPSFKLAGGMTWEGSRDLSCSAMLLMHLFKTTSIHRQPNTTSSITGKCQSNLQVDAKSNLYWALAGNRTH